MQRIQGLISTPKLECINPVSNKWRVRWGFEEIKDNKGTVSYMEEEFQYKPELNEIKELIAGWYNQQIEQKIKTGFTWNKKPVWLSIENQNNFKMFHDLAVLSEGENMPLKIKLGENESGESVYHSFQSIDTYSSFIKAMNKHVQTTLQEGWKLKEAIDWEEYI